MVLISHIWSNEYFRRFCIRVVNRHITFSLRQAVLRDTVFCARLLFAYALFSKIIAMTSCVAATPNFDAGFMKSGFPVR